jgi:deoxyhypusine monooxygenase
VHLPTYLSLSLVQAGEALGAIGDESSLSSLRKYAQDPVVEVAETCQLAVELISWRRSEEEKQQQQQQQRSEQLSDNPYHSVDPAPPCAEHDVAKLRTQLLDTKKPLFKRYRAMFSLRNIGSDAAAVAIADSLGDSSALLRHEVGSHICIHIHVCVCMCVGKILGVWICLCVCVCVCVCK